MHSNKLNNGSISMNKRRLHLNCSNYKVIMTITGMISLCNLTINSVAALLPLVLVLLFNCFKSSVLFDCIDPGNTDYSKNR